MATPYYMPAKLSELRTWALNFASLIISAPATYGLTVPQATLINNAFADFDADYAASTTPGTRTPVTVAQTEVSAANFRAQVQQHLPLIQYAVGSNPATCATLGITFRKTTKTPIPEPTAVPDLAIERIEPLALVIRLKELGAVGNALPNDVTGYEVASKVGLTNPPNSPEDLEIIGTGSRRFYSLSFSSGDIGKQVSLAVRYMTAKGLRGPWSSILTTTVVSG